MFPRALQNWARGVAEGVVAPLSRAGVTPNTVTIVGFLLNVVTAGVIATGHLTAGSILLFLSALFDMLDGALARVSAQQSRFGAFLDSVLDRYSEAVVLAALVYVFTVRGNTPVVILVYTVAIGSVLISYARARAEGLGLDAKVGIAPRPERIIILGVGLLINMATTVAALIILAILTHFTAIQRMYHVWRTSEAPPPSARPDPAPVPDTEPGHSLTH